MARLWRLSQYGLIFAASKSTVLLAPLLAAAVLSQTAYGRVEWWLALSLSLGPLVGMGAAGVVAYGTVGGKLERHLRTATMFTLLVAATLVVLALSMRVFGGSWEEASYGLVTLQCGLICLQTTFSARLKGLGKGALASAIESALYISLLGALLVIRLGIELLDAYAYTLLFLCVLLAAGIVRFTPLPALRRWPRRNYRAFLRVGAVFMVGGALMGGFMAAPRVLLGFWSTPERIAEFTLAFRWLSMAIVVHQFVNTVFFRNIFGDIDIRKRERLLSITVAMVAFGVIAVAEFVKIASLLQPSIPTPHDLGLLLPIALGMILWATTACLEGSLYRLAASGRQTRSVALGCVVLIAVAGGWAISGGEPTYGVTYAWISGLATIIASQYFSLRALGQNFSLLLKSLILIIFCTTILLKP